MAVVVNRTKTLGEMRNSVYFLIAENPNSNRIFRSEFVDDALNMGLNQAGQLFDRSISRAYTNCIIGEAMYAIPDVVMQNGNGLVDRILIDGTELTASDYPVDTDETGVPTEYHVRGNSFTLAPTPDSEYRIDIDYRQEIRRLVEDSDTTWLPDSAVHAAIMYACYLMKLKDEEYRSADAFFEQYSEQIKLLTRLQSGVYRYQDDARYGGAV